MSGFGKQLTVAILLLSTVTFAFGVWVRGYEWSEMFLATVASPSRRYPRGYPPS